MRLKGKQWEHRNRNHCKICPKYVASDHRITLPQALGASVQGILCAVFILSCTQCYFSYLFIYHYFDVIVIALIHRTIFSKLKFTKKHILYYTCFKPDDFH